MSQKLTIGTTVTFIPSEGAPEDYTYTLSNLRVAQIDSATGVLTALQAGQIGVLIRRASDDVTVGRFMFHVLSEADANVTTPLPTFTADIDPPSE